MRSRWRASASPCAARAASSTTAPRRWPAWSRRSSSPPRCSTSRSAPAPAATCSAARSRPSWSARGPRCSASASCCWSRPSSADGGITALGTNITLMGAGHRRGRLAGLPRRSGGPAQRRTTSVAPAAAIAAFVSVPVAALAFVGLYAVGGTADLPLDTLATAMLGVAPLIGIGEAAITGLAVGSIVAVRPDLVYGARPVARPPASSRSAPTRWRRVTTTPVPRRSACSSPSPRRQRRASSPAAPRRAGAGRRGHRASLSRGAAATARWPATTARAASPALLVVLRPRPAALIWTLRRREAPEPADRDAGLTVGAGTATSCTSTATRRSTARRPT